MSFCCSPNAVSDDASAVPVCVNGDARFSEYMYMLRGKRVALVVNHTSVVGDVHLCDTLLAMGVNVVKMFSPEHGIRGNADAGARVASSVDAATGIPVVSLYGSAKKPTPQAMDDVDVVLYDLQDVGVRFYTYISTMHYVMEACAEKGAEFVVLDRPNPNGDYVGGPVLEPDCRSFVGMHPIPVVYGMTAGELACMINGEGWLAEGKRCRLRVVPMRGYSHSSEVSIDVAPSPNLRSDLAIRLYPSLCLFEATNVSVGRGTSNPFTMYGAPGALGTDTFTPRPTVGANAPLHNGKLCNGKVFEPDAVAPQFTLKYFMQMLAEWKSNVSFWKNVRHFELLVGNKHLKKQIESGMSEAEIQASWQPAIDEFLNLRKRYLIYDVPFGTSVPDVESINWNEACHSPWVDSVYNALSLRQRIAQLVWVTYYGGVSPKAEAERIEGQVRDLEVGGVLIMKTTPTEALSLVDRVSSLSAVPPIFAADAENGLAMKFSDVVSFPKNMTLGAISDISQLEQMGERMAFQLLQCGINVNFAPVVDVNTNPRNSIIGTRSFGEDARRVSLCGAAISRGMQRKGVAAVLKHFPGHGDPSQDSHHVLPVVEASVERLDTVELQPFRHCVGEGAMGVMSAHLEVPALDPNAKAASLSRQMLSEVLRKQGGFDGIIVSDALNMGGMAIAAKGKVAEVEALAAGNDVVEFCVKPAKAIDDIEEAVKNGRIPMAELEMKVRRVLALKEWSGFAAAPAQRFPCPEVIINNAADNALADRLYRASVTVLRNNGLETLKVGDVRTFGAWEKMGAPYGAPGATICFVDEKSASAFNTFVSGKSWPNGLVVLYAGNPYRFYKLSIPAAASVVMAYENVPEAKAALQSFVFDGGVADGCLPVSVSGFKCGTGIRVKRTAKP